MSATPQPNREHPSTYIVQDRSNQEEMKRIHIQSQMITSSMGGVLPEQPDPSRFKCVLDVGCGTGNWLIETAKNYADIPQLIGVDVSGEMIHYARALAETEQLSERTTFHVMDALRRLEFHADSFDLVNQRFAGSWLRTWDWTRILSEYIRVVEPGGIIRITEPYIFPEEDSPALERLGLLMRQAFDRSGHLFTPGKDGISNELEPLLKRHSLTDVQTHADTLKYPFGTPEWQSFFDNIQHMLHTLVPFFQKWTRIPDDYQELCEQASEEMQQPEFVATMHVVTVWVTVPLDKKQIRLIPDYR